MGFFSTWCCECHHSDQLRAQRATRRSPPLVRSRCRSWCCNSCYTTVSSLPTNSEASCTRKSIQCSLNDKSQAPKKLFKSIDSQKKIKQILKYPRLCFYDDVCYIKCMSLSMYTEYRNEFIVVHYSVVISISWERNFLLPISKNSSSWLRLLFYSSRWLKSIKSQFIKFLIIKIYFNLRLYSKMSSDEYTFANTGHRLEEL